MTLLSASERALLVQGKSQFTSDLPLPPGCLHAWPVISPHAHARFENIDSRAALAEPGVVAVLTATDISGQNEIGNLFHDEPLLAAQEVFCVGAPYALVIASSADAAWRAAQRVHADWQVLPACFDARSAFLSGNLIQPPRTFALGDVDAQWQHCHTIVSGQVEIGSAEHLYMETQCALAVPQDHGGFKVWSATQSPSVVQKAIAGVTNLPMHQIEVDVMRLGGGFGGKEDQATLWACLATLAAQKTGHAVKIWPDRRDDMRITGKRHPYQADFKLGLSADGRFMAYEAQLFQNAGCAADLSTAILERSLFHATNAYFIPHVRVMAASCRTNLPSNTAFRGFGAPQSIFIMEAAIRAAAQKMNLAADYLQKLNLLADGDTFPYGMQAEAPKAQQCWQRLEQCFSPLKVQQAINEWNAGNARIKKGMALIPVCFGISFTATLLNQAEALVHVYLDGSILLTTGAVEMGQGVHEKLKQVVSRTFGVNETLVKLASTNTSRVANVSPTAASVSADLNGEATRQACLSILRGLRRVAAQQLGEEEDSLYFENGSVRGLQKSLPWEALVQAAYAQRVSLSALAHYATPGLHFDRERNKGRPFAYHVYGVAMVEASVDVLLGTGRIERVSLVHDVGKSLDRQTDLGQIEGAVVQGMGWMTCEDLQHDSKGQLLTDNLANYKIPDLASAPEIEIELLEHTSEESGVLNSKAVGEPPLIYGLGSYFALQAAISAWRTDFAKEFKTPLTSEHIFSALHFSDKQTDKNAVSHSVAVSLEK